MHKSSFIGIPCPSFSQEYGEEKGIAQLGISAVPWWGQKHTVHKAWREIFEEKVVCFKRHTHLSLRFVYWQYLKVMGCSDGSLKTGKPGIADSASPSPLFYLFPNKAGLTALEGTAACSSNPYTMVASSMWASIKHDVGYMPTRASAHSWFHRGLHRNTEHFAPKAIFILSQTAMTPALCPPS